MAKPSFIRKLVKEDFPQKYQDLIGSLGNVLNPALQSISIGLNNGLTIGDNLQATTVNITVTCDVNGNPINPTSFPSNLGSPTQHLLITRAYNLTNTNAYPTGAPFISWVDNGGQVSINNVTGLQANNQYSLRIIVTI